MLQDFKSFAKQNTSLNESVAIKKQINTIQNVLMDLENLGKKWDFEIEKIEKLPAQSYMQFYLNGSDGFMLLDAVKNSMKIIDGGETDYGCYFTVKI